MTNTPNTAPTPETDAEEILCANTSARFAAIQDGMTRSHFARILERQRNASLADNAKLQAALDEAQAACATKDAALSKAYGQLMICFTDYSHPAFTDRYDTAPKIKATMDEVVAAKASTCSKPILARLAAAEEDTKRLAEYVDYAAPLIQQRDEFAEDNERLEWLLAFITQNGANGIAAMQWTVVDPEEIMEDRIELVFDRQAIDAARSANGGAQ